MPLSNWPRIFLLFLLLKLLRPISRDLMDSECSLLAVVFALHFLRRCAHCSYDFNWLANYRDSLSSGCCCCCCCCCVDCDDNMMRIWCRNVSSVNIHTLLLTAADCRRDCGWCGRWWLRLFVPKTINYRVMTVLKWTHSLNLSPSIVVQLCDRL